MCWAAQEPELQGLLLLLSLTRNASSQPLNPTQGEADSFLENQLKPQALQEVAQAKGYPLTLRMQVGRTRTSAYAAWGVRSRVLAE